MSLSALALAGFAVSLGRGPRPVTARLTYSAKLAAQGGMIYAVRDASASDEDAVRLSEALVLTSGGLLGRGASLARAHGVAAVVLPDARWDEAGRLVVQEPSFGPARREGAAVFEPVARTKSRAVAEGEVVTVDAEGGSMKLYPVQDQEGELELAQALKAYEGLRDGPALLHWWQGRSDGPEGTELGLRLADELAARAVDGEGRGQDWSALAEALRSSAPSAQRESVRRRAAEGAAAQAKRGEMELRDLRQDLAEASSETAARDLAGRVDSTCAALSVLDPRGSAAACRSARALAQARSASLAGKPARSWQQAAQAAGARARPGAVIGADAYERFVAAAELAPQLGDISSDASLPLALKSERIRQLFLSASSPAAPAGPGPFDFSCEGASRDGVPAAEAPRALLECWAGFWAPGPLGRRKRAGVSGPPPEVLVSPSLAGALSGAFFSMSAGSSRRLFVSAGQDQYLVDRAGASLLPAIAAGEKAALTAEQLKRLARVARALEDHFGGPVRADFAFDGDALYVASARLSP